jgi:hypothetical protein
MVVLSHDRLSPEFLDGAATANARAALKRLFPEIKIKGRKREEVLDNVDVASMDVTPAQFRAAMWDLVGGPLTGQYHTMQLADSLLRERDVPELLESLRQELAVTTATTTIETKRPLDVRFVQNAKGESLLEILYLGEAEAEVHDSVEDRDEIIGDKKYRLKAYLVRLVPVISKITIGAVRTAPTIMMRPIHQGATPKAQLDGLQQWLEGELDCPVPPVGGVKDGIRQLLVEGRLEPIVLDVEEEDGSKVRYRRAPAGQNETSRQAEDIIKAWETNSGSLRLDNKTDFRVDTGLAIFTFKSGTDFRTAADVIQTVLGSRN